MSDLYIYYYLVINIFSTYVVTKYFNIFFEGHKKYGSYVNMAIVVSYYLVIAFVHLYFNIPLLTMLTNIGMFFVLTALYQTTIKKRILSVALIYSVLLLVECGSVLIVMLLKEDVNSILSFAVSQIVSLLLLGLFQRKYALKDDVLIPKLQLISIVVFPVGGLILFYFITTFASDLMAFVCLMILLLFNVLIIYIFDEMNSKYRTILSNKIMFREKQHELELYQHEKMIYEKQLEIIEQNQEEIQMLRHDFNGHMMILSGLCNRGETQEVMDYLSRLFKHHKTLKQYIDTGNTAIDCILNFNIQVAENKGIKMQADIKIPSDLNIESFDISVILGNTMQNAIEATEKTDTKSVNITMSYDRGILFIEIENSYNNSLIENDNTFLTTKEDKENHGLGLKNVQKCIQRYDGDIDFDTTAKGIFKVSILLYI